MGAGNGGVAGVGRGLVQVDATLWTPTAHPSPEGHCMTLFGDRVPLPLVMRLLPTRG